MNKILPIVLLIAAYNLHSQNNSKWQMRTEFSWDRISEGAYINSIFNYSLGVKSIYSISKRFTISSGVLYSNKDYYGRTFNDSVTCCISATLEQKHRHFMTIPLYVAYTPFNGKIMPSFEFGFNNNFSLSKQNYSEIFSGITILFKSEENWTFGFGYRLGKSLTMSNIDYYDVRLKSTSISVKLNYRFN